MSTIFWVLIGAFFGWNIPQPTWARYIQEKVITSLKSRIND